MSRARRIALAALVLAPIAVLVLAGAWTLIESGRLLWLSWIFPLCWGIAWLVARKKPRSSEVPPALSDGLPAHWTPRDRAAARLVDARIARVGEQSTELLAEPRFYLDTGLELANEIAHHYHPRAKDPIGPLRVSEILAALNLVFEDLERRVEDYVPGSHVLRIDHWRLLARSPAWIEVATNVSRVVSTVLSPLNLGRFLLSQSASEPVKDRVRQSVLASLYALFLRELGFYLIEMHSGRLRGGSARYVELLGRRGGGPAEPGAAEVTVALVGQIGAGKSSLIHCLFGERQVESDGSSSTREVRRHRYSSSSAPDLLTLLDTPGYGAAGASEREREKARDACRRADLVLLVMDVQNQARAANVELLRSLGRQARAHEKPPPVLGVLTHVDRLSPVLEWQPPYDWKRGEKPKEQNVRQALEYVRSLFGESLAGLVPVASDFDGGRVYGVVEQLLPAMTALLGEGRARSLLRALHEELDRARLSRVLRQLRNAGRSLVRAAR